MMNFNSNKYKHFQEMFAGMSPEMKEQMMKMAKAQMKSRLVGFCKKWLSLPALSLVALLLGTFIGALMAFFGRVLLLVGNLRDAHPLYFIPLLALVGVGIVFAYKKWGKGSERGLNLVFAVGQGKESGIPWRMIPFVAVGTWMTHLFGGSAGREGVAMQMGAALGHGVGKKLPFENAGHILLVAGMAAGFSGLFQIPLAATIFALEVLIVGYLDLKSLFPTAIASFAACKVSNMLGLPKFSVDLNGLLEKNGGLDVFSLFVHEGSLDVNFILKLALLGVLFGIVGGGFAKVLKLSRAFFAKKFPNEIRRVAVMGVVLSILFLLLWQGRYSGLGTNLIDWSFIGANGYAEGIYNYDWILKFVLTILTLSAGFVGGEVTPLFSIGASFGAVASVALGLPFPLAAALGYAAVFGSATKTWLAPMFIGCEIFGFGTLPAFFVVCIVAYACNGGQSIYSQKRIELNYR